MNTKIILIIICLLVGIPRATSQNKVDSLLKTLNQPQADTSKLNIYSQIIKSILYSSPTEARKYANLYLETAKKTKLKKELARGTNFIGMTYHVSGEIDKALNYYIEALKIYEETKDSLYIGISMNNIAACYQFREKPKETIAYYENALNVFRKIKSEQWIANVSYNLSNQLTKQKNFKKAYQNSVLALETFRKLKDKYSEGLVYTQLGTINLDQEIYDIAISYFTKSNQLISLEEDPIAVGINYENLGSAYTALGNYKEAEKNLLRGIDIFKKHQSLEHLTKTLDIAKMLYERWGKFEEAFIYSEEYRKMKDSLFNATKDERLLETIKKYDLDKKEQQISLLQTQNELKDLRIKSANEERLFYSLGILALIIIAGTGFYLYQTKKKSSEELSRKNEIISQALAEKEDLMREIHHRVKNNLQVVSSLLSIQSRHVTDSQVIEAIKEGQNRVKTMGLIHQNLYQDNDLRGVDMKNYVQKLTKNLFSSYNIEPDKIRLKTDIETSNLDVDTVVPLGLIINELVTNSLKYAFTDKTSGEIFVKLHENNEKLILEVGDNGRGLPEGFDIQKLKSMGFQLVQNFVRKLSAEFKIQSENGTKISILIPKTSKTSDFKETT